MTTKPIELTNSSGQKLSARLELPVHGRAKSYAIVAHCFTCSKDFNALRAIARAMTHVGIGVIRFDFTGLGQSEGEFSETTLATNVGDLVGAVHQIEDKLGPVELLVGHSLGGAAVILAAEQLPEVRAVATIGAPSEPVHVKEHFEDSVDEIRKSGEAVVEIEGREFTVSREFIEDLETTHLRDALADLGRPLLVLHAPRDEVVGIEHATKIFKAARHPRSFVALDGADHMISDPDQAAYVGQLIASWARRYVNVESVDEWRADRDTGKIAASTEDEMRTEVVASGFALVADEAPEKGGSDKAPKPHDLVGAGLASCMTMTLRMYADRKDWPLDEATVHVDFETVKSDDSNQYIDRFKCRLEVKGDLDDEQRQRLLEISKRCPVHRTLTRGAEVEAELVE